MGQECGGVLDARTSGGQTFGVPERAEGLAVQRVCRLEKMRRMQQRRQGCGGCGVRESPRSAGPQGRKARVPGPGPVRSEHVPQQDQGRRGARAARMRAGGATAGRGEQKESGRPGEQRVLQLAAAKCPREATRSFNPQGLDEGDKCPVSMHSGPGLDQLERKTLSVPERLRGQVKIFACLSKFHTH